MKQTEIIMGMPITIEICDPAPKTVFESIYTYFRLVDKKYSPYKKNSELSQINRGLLKKDWSKEMLEVLELCEETKKISNGYFDIKTAKGSLDPSGLVKGWSINHAASELLNAGYSNFYIEAGGDIQTFGFNEAGNRWAVGIRNPFDISQIVKVVNLSGQGIATSGSYIRGDHIYNPKHRAQTISDVSSLTVIGPNVYEADRFATAAFAMGHSGLQFIQALPGFEAYLIDNNKTATFTQGFDQYVV